MILVEIICNLYQLQRLNIGWNKLTGELWRADRGRKSGTTGDKDVTLGPHFGAGLELEEDITRDGAVSY